ncbi:MAG: hypothetical protein KBG10_08820 [Anaerolineaceae bacterium]|nr:hypothetical protein [Anaerolineaceae bacterium]
MKKSRLIGFFIAILIGIAGGLMLGWLFNPNEAPSTRLRDLREDFKADYVLMVAEAYAGDGDLGQAINRLEQLNPDNPLRAAQEGLLTAQKMGYQDWEMRYLIDLEAAVRQWKAEGETP